MAYSVGIVGASGYTGAESLRLVAGHPALEIAVATSREFAGQAVSSVYPNLQTDLAFTQVDLDQLGGLDLVLLALPHGASAEVAEELSRSSCRIVDLSADFRFSDPSIYQEWFGRKHPTHGSLPGWIFGLPELYRDQIAHATKVANPGCYPTSALLALAPFVEAGAIDLKHIVVTAASGVSGAGRSASPGVHFSHVDSNFKPYGAPKHKHTPEIEQELSRIAGEQVTITFVPHLAPMPRGLLSTAIVPYSSDTDPMSLLAEAYASEPFVKVLEGWPETKFTSGSNLALVSARLDERTGNLITCCAIDNLGKGAAGQAIQNANLMLGLEETAGLMGGGIYP